MSLDEQDLAVALTALGRRADLCRAAGGIALEEVVDGRAVVPPGWSLDQMTDYYVPPGLHLEQTVTQ